MVKSSFHQHCHSRASQRACHSGSFVFISSRHWRRELRGQHAGIFGLLSKVVKNVGSMPKYKMQTSFLVGNSAHRGPPPIACSLRPYLALERRHEPQFLYACAHVVANTLYGDLQALSSRPGSVWAETSGSEASGTSSLDQLLRLRTAFATARRLLREMGEVRGRVLRNTGVALYMQCRC